MSIRSPKPLVQYLILAISLPLFLANANATTYFVRSGASGNGTSWANAWGNVSSISWSSLNAGDTVCIAGGAYGSGISTGKAGTTGSPITLRRATASDPTCGAGSAGWNAAYDAQVNLGTGGINIGHSYVTIDGMVDNGILVTMNNGGSCGICANSGSMTGDIVRYVEVSGPGTPAGINQNSDSRGFSIAGSATATNWLVSHLNLHGQCTNVIVTEAPGLIFEHSRLADSMDHTPGNPNCHPNVFEVFGGTNITFRYNEVTNWEVEGIMICPNGNCGATVTAHGNLFHDPYPSSGVARVLETQGPGTNGPHHLYNNTIVGVPYSCVGTANGGAYAAGSSSYNNLLFGNAFSNCSGMSTSDYDASDGNTGQSHGQNNISSSIFVNRSAHTVAGYHLASHTTAGFNLGAPYNVDFDGKARGTWDRGAFESGGSSASLPNPPGGLVAVVQ